MSEEKKKPLTTKGAKPSTGTDSMPKTIQPGNVTARILSIEVVPFPWEGKNKGLPEIILQLETKPITGFTGFQRVKDDPAQGNYAGQVGKVKAGSFPFSDYTGDNGTITKEEKMISFLFDLCSAVKKGDWFTNLDKEFATIEEMVKYVMDAGTFKDKWLDWCIGGNKYKNKQGYTTYSLSLPRFQYKKKPFVASDATPEEKVCLITFDASEHVYENKNAKKKNETVTDFGSTPPEGGETLNNSNDLNTGGGGEGGDTDFAF